MSRYLHRTFAVEAILKINKQTAFRLFFIMKNVRFMESGVCFFSCGFCSGTELCGVFRSLPNRWCLQHVFEALLSQVQKIKKRDEVGCGWSCQHHSTRQVVGLALLSGITDVRFLLAGHTWFKTQIFVNILFLPWERKEDKNLSTMPFLHWFKRQPGWSNQADSTLLY